MNRLSSVFKPLALAALLYASHASAAFYVDTTEGSPTFNRPFEDLSGLSGIGTAVAYDAFSFSVDTAGTYSFRSFAQAAWDNFLILYTGPFDAGDGLTNATIANDDFNTTVGRAGFDIALTTGVAYTLVTTSYNNENFGKYLNLIRGPGALTAPVPEPETYLLMLAGLGAIGFMARRRNAT